ncbi:MAG: D-2-hydroxyacid dehydrogenase [Terriglobia bacterium]|jgi:phosphoglycerate dehydrogenase-like enzyme
MANKSYSRRRFLGNIAAGSTGTALATLPGGKSASAAGAIADPPYPVTMVSYPLYAAAGPFPLENIKIVTTDEIPKSHEEKLQSFSPTLKLHQCRSFEEFHREVVDAHVIFADFTRQDFANAKQLRWIQTRAAGVEELVIWPELVESPVVLTNMQKIYSFGISETVIGLLLSLAHGLNKYAVQTSNHLWKPVDSAFMQAMSARRFGNGRDQPWNLSDDLREISGLTMGVVGLGGIGGESAYRAHFGFGIRILAVDPKPLPKPAFVAELHSLDWLPKMVPQVDVLLCAAPHTKESVGMINESIFRAMKPTAYFINASRGTLVDTPALVRALKEGWIAGAGLDVTEPEPLPPEHPLWTAGNVLITSHTSGHSGPSIVRALDLFSENVRRYVNGLPLLNVVDKVRGY